MPAFYSMTGAAIITFCALILFPLFLVKLTMFSSTYLPPLLGLFYVANSSPPKVDLSWHPPKKTQINDLNAVIHGTGVFGGYIFNSSQDPSGVSYGTYNWCNMPHVRTEEYIIPPKEYQLEYVELIHRHHKRTPYTANTFPHESYSWDCSDEGLYFYGEPLNPSGNKSSPTYWSVYTTSTNPFAPQGFGGTCQFPQITRGGLDDSHQHGLDLYNVYHSLLHFLPSTANSQISYRVTNNVITSQVAGMLVNAMYAPSTPYPLLIQPASIDSLEPTYTCSDASTLYSNYSVGSTSPAWLSHLTASAPLFASLDALSGVSPNSTPFHMSYDHYYDNLSSRQCHSKPLPCQIGNSQNCVSQSTADAVYRLGIYEYSYIYRDAPQSLTYSVARYGVFIAELAQHIRDRITGSSPVIYRHNVAHDGSVSPLLSILQVEVMVWPGMGAEVVFEVYSRKGKYFVRVLWGGKVLRSSNPSLGTMDMVDVDVLLAYFDGLVGRGASKVPGLCGSSDSSS